LTATKRHKKHKKENRPSLVLNPELVFFFVFFVPFGGY